MSVTASASGEPSTQRAAIDCPSGYVCIYPEINFGGQPTADAGCASPAAAAPSTTCAAITSTTRPAP
ncbi:peptidase inhibitor family I36 protein [Streptomyces sp. DH10]|uniref:peptidase inhibitor family I36 protein n=1 Tax=Streptomyces sp. DH10 TaxID=3040121 RepID=UPI002442F838|nr:peptidase inhibitor family I36 protein [Streptomyces sp. DH10]MDG9709486.1 peptidase inhibitor family I36 protein [Streptomyces sp. DH10]